MAKKKNRYEKKANKEKYIKFIKGDLKGQGDAKATFLVTAKDVVLGVLAGRFIAVHTAGFNVPIGIAATAAGHFLGIQSLTAVGIGTMAASNGKKSDTVSGIEGLDGFKDQNKVYKESLMEDFFINKLLKKKAVNGFGEVQYFDYPSETMGELAALDNVEDQLIESGMQFQGTEEYSLVDGLDDDPLY